MGEGRGAPSFFLSITSFPKHGHDMHVLMPGRPGSVPRGGLPRRHAPPLHEQGQLHARGWAEANCSSNEASSHVSLLVRPRGPRRQGAREKARRRRRHRHGRTRSACGLPHRPRDGGVPNVTRLFGIGMYLDRVREAQTEVPAALPRDSALSLRPPTTSSSATTARRETAGRPPRRRHPASSCSGSMGSTRSCTRRAAAIVRRQEVHGHARRERHRALRVAARSREARRTVAVGRVRSP